MRRVWFRSLARWMDRARGDVLPPDASPAPQNLSQHRAYWGELMTSDVVPVAGGILARVRNRMTGRPEPQAVVGADEARYLNEVGNRLRHVPDEVYALIVREIEEGLTRQESIPAIRDRVQAVMTATATPYWRNRATVVARTEVQGAVQAGAYFGALAAAQERGDFAPRKVWIATVDKRTRATHKAADRQSTLLAEPFRVGGAQLMFPGDPRGSAQEVINCFPGDTQVRVPSGLVAVYRRQYEGSMVRVQMSDGVELSATPNHPLLTETGWKRAEALQAGDKLCGAPLVPGVGSGEPDVEHVPTTFHELYRAAMQAGVSRRVVGRAVDFHGDGTDAEVQVVLPHLGLSQEVHPGEGQAVGDQPFVGLSHALGAFPGPSDIECGLFTGDGSELGTVPPADGLMRSFGESFPLFDGRVGHADVHGLAAPPNGQVQLVQSSRDDRPTDAEVVRQALDGLPGGMSLREVVQVDLFAFHGYVYNLQSADGWYIANDTASGNCRCSAAYLVDGETLDFRDRQDP